MNTCRQSIERTDNRINRRINLKEIEKILKNIKEYEAKVKSLELEISDLKDLQSINLKGINYDNLVKTSSMFSKTELCAIKDLEIQQTIDLLEYKKRHIERFLIRIKTAIDSLNDIEKQIIRMKCLDNKIWRFVTYEVNLEERQCREIKKKALKKISDLISSRNIMGLEKI